jgi:hypothetical protein
MTKRERRLVHAIVPLAMLTLALYGLTAGLTSSAGLRAALDKKRDQLLQLQGEIPDAQEALLRVDNWKKHSLPWTRAAKNLYQQWLCSKAVNAKLKVEDFHPGTETAVRGAEKNVVYRTALYHAKVSGTLDQLTDFLFAFYSAGYSHKLKSVNITPDSDGKMLETALLVEVLFLPGADNRDKVNESPERPLLARDEYYTSIFERNIFAPYVETLIANIEDDKTPSKPLPPPPLDPARFAYLKAIVVDVQGNPQIWLHQVTSDEPLFKLSEGDLFQSKRYPKVNGKVVEINVSNAVFDLDGQRRKVMLGDTLKHGTPLPD